MKVATKAKTVPDLFSEATNTFIQRNELYGDSYKKFGNVMSVLFPHGIGISNGEDFSRLGLLNMIVSKLIRYCSNFHDPHNDSIHDLGVYAVMLEELDQFHVKEK
jgi:hypothetical protein